MTGQQYLYLELINKCYESYSKINSVIASGDMFLT